MTDNLQESGDFEVIEVIDIRPRGPSDPSEYARSEYVRSEWNMNSWRKYFDWRNYENDRGMLIVGKVMK
jgi:hypothetical protein